jgi:hypothetical protein
MKTIEELAKNPTTKKKLEETVKGITDLMEMLHINEFKFTAKYTDGKTIKIDLEVKR